MAGDAPSALLDAAIRANAEGRPAAAEALLTRLLKVLPEEADLTDHAGGNDRAAGAAYERGPAYERGAAYESDAAHEEGAAHKSGAAYGSGAAHEEPAYLRGRAYVTLALTHHERGRVESASELLDLVDRSSWGRHTGAVHILSTIQRAGLAGRSGDWARARELLAGIDVSSPDASPRARTVTALNLGLSEQFLGNLTASDGHLRRAEQLAVIHHLDDLAMFALHNRGRLAFLRGNLPEALALMGSARDLPMPEPTFCALDHARVLIESGLLSNASALLTEVEATARRTKLTHDAAEALLERARLAVLGGDPGTAVTVAAEAAEMFAARREGAWRAQAQLLLMEGQLEARLASSRRVAARALALAGRESQGGDTPDGGGRAGHQDSSDLRVDALHLAALALARCGEFERAESALAQVPPGRVNSFARTLQRLAIDTEIAHRRGDRARAATLARRATKVLAREQSRYASLDTRSAIALHSRRLNDLDLSIALDSGSPAQLFAAVERWRSVSFRLPRVTPSPDPEIAHLTQRARALRLEARGSTGAHRDQLAEEIAEVEASIAQRDWQTVHGPRAGRWGGASPQLTLTRVRRDLGPDTALLSFTAHHGELHALTVTRAGVRHTRVADLDLVREIAQRVSVDLTTRSVTAPGALREAVDRSLLRTVERLDDLLGPALALRVARVVVVPGSTLATFPWRLLPRLQGKPVTITPSATFWSPSVGGHPSTGLPPNAYAADLTTASGPDLVRAQAEAHRVADAWRSRTPEEPERVVELAGVAANGSALTRALQDSRVVHIAAHGSHHEQSPLFSSVLLGDGPLFTHEFQRVGVRAQHVILSACDVGRAVVRPGDEALGLTAGLLVLGVDSVVAAVAPVRDDSAERAMAAYHHELSAGTDAATALMRASEGVPDGRLFAVYGRDWRR